MAEKMYIDINHGDEIVISGIAGRFPDSNNINQLRENLFNEVDLVRENHGRWDTEHPDLPKRMGTVNDVEKFDNDFFNISDKQAHTLDPMARLLLEHAYEAIVDAGINPMQMRGKKTAVIVGSTVLESQAKFMYENLQVDGMGFIGCSKSTLANIISYCLDLRGPSYTVDSACGSSLYAMAFGYQEIMSGRCEDAIIGTAHLCLHPIINISFSRLGILSSDGSCKPFDSDGSGYSRSETVSVVYLQKAKNAKRIYAVCKHIKVNNDGYKEEGITFPSMHMQSALMTECYKECGISPFYLDYMEAHSTGTDVGDTVEINAIQNALCKGRKVPLMIGSVKSNLGHAEPASGFTQIAKAIIAFETGLVSPNINCTSLRDDIDAFSNGTIRVLTRPLTLKNGYIGINSFGFGGCNAHLLLKWNIKQKINNGAPSDDLPRLVTLSGRTEESVDSFLNDVAKHPTDAEYIRLLHDVHADNIAGHSWRGYIVLDPCQENLIKKIQRCENVKRPICFIFSALGSQWPKIGENLLQFYAFANAVRTCDIILKPYDISVMKILKTKYDETCKNALHTFVGIIAVQIGLVDLLTSLEIIPDYIMSHFAGELGCAYADKCLTIEQTILSAYFIGLACVEGNITHSSMAVVDLNYKSLKNICPTDIQIVCYNNVNSNVVTGPAESMQEFLKKLQINNINVRGISCDIPYHSRYLESLETRLLLNLNRIISQPNKRSSRWISTSVPCVEWSHEESKLSSANYHTRSILNTVLFEQATRLIPTDAVVIEIAPDGVLRYILKESLHPNVTNIALIQGTDTEQNTAILRQIGELYNCGLQPQIAHLYPPVEFPVSRRTPMISPSLRWDHSKDWYVTRYELQKTIKSGERLVKIRLDEIHSYMIGYVIDGENLLPATGYLALVWETVGMMKGQLYTTMPIVFRNLNFIRATYLSDKTVKLMITIQKDTGQFEVMEGDSLVVTGTVHTVSNPKGEMIPIDLLPENDEEEEEMTTRDIYKELKLRGYQYSGYFCGLKSASVSGNRGHIVWAQNWVTFMESMLQLHILGYDTRDLCIPTSIQKLVIDPARHQSKLWNTMAESDKQLPVHIYTEIDAIISGGIEIQGAKFTVISRQNITQNPVIEEQVFVAHHDRAKISLDEAIRISAQLVTENHQIVKVKAVEFVEEIDDITLENLSCFSLIKTFNNTPLGETSITLVTSPSRFNSAKLPENITIAGLNKLSVNDKVLIAFGFNLLTKPKILLEHLLLFVMEGGYVLTREKCDIIDGKTSAKRLQQYKLNVILEKRTDTELILLLKKQVSIKKRAVVYINNNDFNWLEHLKLLVNDESQCNNDSRIIIVGEGDFECGLLGFINCLRKESGGEFVRGVLIQDPKAPKFSLQDPFYAQQLQKDMTINVLRSNNTWGSYKHLELPPLEAKPVSAAYVCQTIRGDLSKLCWTENDISIDSHREDLVRVIYSPINFRDVMLATTKINSCLTTISQEQFQRIPLGIEYVGFDANGQRVMGLCNNKCIANVVVKDKDLCWNIPDTWTFEEAATVSCAYSTCYLALYIYGKMKKGDKILIHSGTEDISQAAIHLALREECEVFTTVDTVEKREFIKKTFPTITDEHIGNSRDISFERMIMLQAKKVDIVLNSLTGEDLMAASIRCLAPNGRFLENLVSNNSLDMSVFQKGINFHKILLDSLFVDCNKHKSLLSKMMVNGMKNGAIKPIEVKVFQKTEIETAFKYMTNEKNMGKTILKIQDEDELLNELIVVHRCYYCLSDRSYVILGGLGGVGLELTDWLIQRGAKNVVLISRSGIKNGYQRMRVELWRSYGVSVLVVQDIDVADSDDCERLLKTAEKRAPVDAIFNLAMVLEDHTVKTHTTDTFAKSFKSKAWATQMLDKLSRKICSRLRHFVVFSSISCGRGNPGQTNYGMANSVMERICEKRVEDGLPGLAIQWGAMGDVGFVADLQEDDKIITVIGTAQQKLASCLEELEKFLLQDRPIVSSIVLAEKKVTSSGVDDLVGTVANMLNIKDMKKMSQNASLAELGVDSMMVTEIKQTLEQFDIFLSMQEIRNLTFGKLHEMSNANEVNKVDVLQEDMQAPLILTRKKSIDLYHKTHIPQNLMARRLTIY